MKRKLHHFCHRGTRTCIFIKRAAWLTGPVIVLIAGAALIGEFYPMPHIIAMLTEAIGAAAADSLVE